MIVKISPKAIVYIDRFNIASAIIVLEEYDDNLKVVEDWWFTHPQYTIGDITSATDEKCADMIIKDWAIRGW